MKMLEFVNKAIYDEKGEKVKDAKNIARDVQQINQCVDTVVQVWINRKIFDVDALEKFKESFKSTIEPCEKFMAQSTP